MIDPRIVQYIQENIRIGYSVDEIKKMLLSSGYPKDYVDNAIRQVMPQQNAANTPRPAIKPNVQYGGFWIRLAAYSWDFIIIGLPASILALALLFLTGIKSLQYLVSLAALVLVIYFEGIKGGTPGKLILGLRINNDSGKVIGIPKAILRNIGKILSALLLGIGYLMIAWDSKKQGLHDKIANTFVVKKPEIDRKALVVIGIIIFFLPFVFFPLIFVGSIAYFGVLSPDKFLPSKCTMPAGIACIDHEITEDSVSVSLRNAMGVDINDASISITGCGGTSAFPQSINNGQTTTFTVNCNEKLKGGTFSSIIYLSYTDPTKGSKQTVSGALTGKIG